MSVQYRDGSFSENMPIDEAFEEFTRAIRDETARALHVGSEKELDHIKQKKKLEDQVTELSERLEKLEQPPVKSSSVVIPTRDEMIRALRG